jgi:hypothetical protein
MLRFLGAALFARSAYVNARIALHPSATKDQVVVNGAGALVAGTITVLLLKM